MSTFSINDYQAIVRYNLLRGLSFGQCYDEMRQILGPVSPSRENVASWYSKHANETAPTHESDNAERGVPLQENLKIRTENHKDLLNNEKEQSSKEVDMMKLDPLDDADVNTNTPISNIVKEEMDIVDEAIDYFDYDNYYYQLECKEIKFNNSNESVENIIEPCEANNKIVKLVDKHLIEETNKLKSDGEENNDLAYNAASEIEPVRPYLCKYCGRSYKSKQRAKRHTKDECIIKNGANTKFYCKTCDRYFMTKYTLDRHTLVVHKKHHNSTLDHRPKFSCDNCGKTYRLAGSLRRHRNYECNQQPVFGCAHCDHRTTQKANLIMHLARMHNIPERLEKEVCSQCGRKYKNKCSLERHRKFECGKKPAFSCKKCGYVTKRAYSLEIHVKNKHAT